jgi:magnesium transporter
MLRFLKRTSAKAGLPPGTLLHIGDERTHDVNISIIDYAPDRVDEKAHATIDECAALKDKPSVTWINVNGIHNVSVMEAIGNAFNLHPLLLEDVMHTGQRPKIDDYETHLFVVLKMVKCREDHQDIEVEQISIVIGPGYVISFQEFEGDVFDAIRERIRNGKGKIRHMGSDYIAYALIDAVVDNYFLTLERIGEVIETLQDEVLTDPGPETLQDIQQAKRDMLFFRKSVWPLREAVGILEREDFQLVTDSVRPYLRDIYDHTIQVIDTVEAFRDLISGTLDVYLSSLSNRMNEVMKMLTIIATIFIPLTFIAGVYGMNFKYMPELEWRWGYFAVWGIMALLAALMLIGFRKKKWL